MNGVLLDSHTFLWLLQEPKKVGPHSKELIETNATVFVSLATIWELSLKYQKQKLKFEPPRLLEAIQIMGAVLLPIQKEHILTELALQLNHKDPFDKLLIAQAKYENLTLMTADRPILAMKLPFIANARQ